ncbi:MAG: hypothetical protein EBR30_20300 [Cytophagia bacterium]|nr:hypothetical protein [Cytophagia bacterium]
MLKFIKFNDFTTANFIGGRILFCSERVLILDVMKYEIELLMLHYSMLRQGIMLSSAWRGMCR